MLLCGALIVLGLFTRLATIPLIVIMVVAAGPWSVLHEARTDLTMLLGSIYLLIEGGGRWSLDAWHSSIRSGHSARALNHSLERGA